MTPTTLPVTRTRDKGMIARAARDYRAGEAPWWDRLVPDTNTVLDQALPPGLDLDAVLARVPDPSPVGA